MFASIRKPGSIRAVLTYHDQKVEDKKASLIHGENFLSKTEDLTYAHILARMQDRMTLNDKAVKKVAHIVLSFHPLDNLTDASMIKLSRRYMTMAGYSEQPYVIYRHFDSANPHLHIVSTTVRADRMALECRPSLMRQLHALTREMEREFGLIPNHLQTTEEALRLQEQEATRLIYGKESLRQSISKVLKDVVDHYHYSTLDELNAVLGLYNVVAITGKEGSPLFQRRGLVYAATDEMGKQVSRGLAASGFEGKPVLGYLEQRMVANTPSREQAARRLSTAIEWIFAGGTPDWEGFRAQLERDGIDVVMRGAPGSKTGGPESRGKEGAVYFVDHHRKAVFEGSGLAADYSLAALRERCTLPEQLKETQILSQRNRIRL